MLTQIRFDACVGKTIAKVDLGAADTACLIFTDGTFAALQAMADRHDDTSGIFDCPDVLAPASNATLDRVGLGLLTEAELNAKHDEWARQRAAQIETQERSQLQHFLQKYGR